MRKLMLPLIAACAVFGVSAAPTFAASANVNQNKKIGKINGAMKGVKKAIKQLEDADKGQVAAINRNVADITALSNTVSAVIKTATDALGQLKTGLEAAGAGLLALKAAVEGPNVAGQLGAAGSDLPGAANTATPSGLPTGTVYRQVVLAGPGPAVGAPLGIRTWVKMPEVTSPAPLYSNNEWVCVADAATGKVAGGAFDAAVACPAGTST